MHDGGPLSLFHVTYVWGKLSGYAATLTKGTHVQIEGEIRTREYTPKSADNQSTEVKTAVTEIRVTSISKLDHPKKAGAEDTAA